MICFRLRKLRKELDLFFFRDRKLSKALRELLKRAIDFGMVKDNLADINNYIDEGEYECALHYMLYDLDENYTKIDLEFYADTQLICALMEMPLDTHAYMKELIDSPMGMVEFKKLIHQKVDRLFLVVWSPEGELKSSDIDMSFGIVFQNQPEQLCVITTDPNDMWTPLIRYENIPQFTYSWDDFGTRMNAWMKMEQDGDIEYEYYELSTVELFKDIVSETVRAVELLRIADSSEPFGVKLIFDKDYTLSTPISDGNTVETSRFNKNGNISFFERLGPIEFVNLNM
jgi:hypothetical protein